MKTVVELWNIAGEKGVPIDYFTLNKREALSLMDTDGQCYIAIDPDKIQSSADETVKIAHELGHCETGSFYNQYSPFDIRQKHENTADKWAIRNLISEEELDEAVAAGHTTLYALADYFGVTEDFVRKAVCWYTYGNVATELYF